MSLLNSTALAGLSCGSILSGSSKDHLTYSVDWNGQERSFKLPSIVNEISKQKNIKAIIFAGNTFYEGTRHNLGFHLADHIIETRFNHKEEQSETIDALFDDGSTKSGRLNFSTAPGVYRTRNGEIVPVTLTNGEQVVLIKPIGDYNEIGDFAVPALAAMDISPADAILVSDNIDVELGELSKTSGLITPDGNNSLVSLNRNLAIQSLNRILSSEQLPYGNSNAANAVAELSLSLLAKLNVRSGNKRIADAEALKTALVKGLKTIFKTIIVPEELKKITDPALEITKERGALLKEAHSNKALSPEAKRLILDKVDQIENQLEPIKSAESARAQELHEAFDKFEHKIVNLIAEGMSFTRLSLGTGRPDSLTSMHDFVLGPFPQDVFNNKYWQRAEAYLAELLSD